MKKICKTCKQEFEGESWMKQCWDCYKNFKGLKRIQLLGETGYTRGVFIVTHPDASNEEVNEYIKKRFGSVNTPENWGAVEVPKKKMKLWWNCQNTD